MTIGSKSFTNDLWLFLSSENFASINFINSMAYTLVQLESSSQLSRNFD